MQREMYTDRKFMAGLEAAGQPPEEGGGGDLGGIDDDFGGDDLGLDDDLGGDDLGGDDLGGNEGESDLLNEGNH